MLYKYLLSIGCGVLITKEPGGTELGEKIRSILLEGNKDIKVIVITSAGEKSFSAGVDISEHTEEKAEKMLQVFHDIFRNLSKLDQVTVAALKGLTLGGGCEVALFCDRPGVDYE